MDKEPKIASKNPVKVFLEDGESYTFCTCGHSTNQPFCDGSHSGTGFVPQTFTAKKDGAAYLCQCKHSANQPYCDGKHKDLLAQESASE